MAARSLSKNRAVTGICVTASHNPPRDNGVKLIDPSGHVLSQEWEPAADALARAEGGEELEALTRELFAKAGSESSSPSSSSPSSSRPVVWIAHDSRPSSPALAAAAKAGAEAGGAEAELLGEMTTPQLHWLVAAANSRGERSKKPTLEDYYDELARGHAELVAGTEPLTKKKENDKSGFLFVDAAAGVGGGATEKLAAKCAEPGGLLIRVANGPRSPANTPRPSTTAGGRTSCRRRGRCPTG